MVNKSLMALVDEASKIEMALIQSGGEITPEVEKLIEIKDLQLPEKVDGYDLVMERMESISRFYEEKANMFLKMAESAGNVGKELKFRIKNAMALMATDEISGFDVRFKMMSANPTCIIDDETKIEGHYKITEIVTKIDKKKIAEDLKLGVPVVGAHLEHSQYVRRFVNKPTKKGKQDAKE